MKKLFLVLILSLVFVILNSQFTAFGGLTNSWIPDRNYSRIFELVGGSVDSGSVQNFHFGVSYINYNNTESIVLFEPGITFLSKGWENTGTVLGFIVDEKQRLNYLDFSMKAKLNTGQSRVNTKENRILIYPYIGASFCNLLNARSILGDGSTVNIREHLRDTDFTLMFGADMLIDNRFIFGIGYIHGLQSVFKDSIMPDEYHRSLTFSVGMVFNR